MLQGIKADGAPPLPPKLTRDEEEKQQLRMARRFPAEFRKCLKEFKDGLSLSESYEEPREDMDYKVCS